MHVLPLDYLTAPPDILQGLEKILPLILQLIAASRCLCCLELSGDADLINILQIPTLGDVALNISALDPLLLPLPWLQLTALPLECFGQRTGHDREVKSQAGRIPNNQAFKRRGPAPNHSPPLQSLAFTGWDFHFKKWPSELVAPNLRFLQIGNVLFDKTPSFPACLRVDIDPNWFTSTSLLQFFTILPDDLRSPTGVDHNSCEPRVLER
ncbi:hypothetical protein MSAN_01036300 [Mycena sanguinolenta]|uniref:Uncharacterized protein n=1 Tax=Mycena sanguinolenta TaxID=230812 RepID=A0A8H6YSI7_9AGAR|nr:hypothetical protein MSAN_01036300 [Mycena sanguinolenta]